MAYQDLVIADGPLCYWPLETLDVSEDVGGAGGGGNRYYYYFSEIVNPAASSPFGTASLPHYAFRVGQVDSSGTPTPPSPPLITTPGLATANGISQWVPTLGSGARNVTAGGATSATEDAGSNVLAPATGTLEFWFRWRDAFGYQVSGTTWVHSGTSTARPFPVDTSAVIYGKDQHYAWQVIAYGADIGIRYVSTNTSLPGPVAIFASRANDGASDSMADGELHHLAFVFDQVATTCLIYRDGVHIGGTQVPGLTAGTNYQDASDWNGAGAIYTGAPPQTQLATPQPTTYYDDFTGWNGQLGHVALYTTKLTASQILAHYTAGKFSLANTASGLNRSSGLVIPSRGIVPVGITRSAGVAVASLGNGLIDSYGRPRTMTIHGTHTASGASVYAVLEGHAGWPVHLLGLPINPVSDATTTDGSGYWHLTLIPPGDFALSGLRWRIFITGGTPL